jgi:drug/metabolite transporter (DMT)-like permease
VQPERLRNYALLALLALLWGASYNFAKVAVQTIPPVTTRALRITIAALALAAILRHKRVTLFDKRYPWRILFLQAWIINIMQWTESAWGMVLIVGSVIPMTMPRRDVRAVTSTPR